MTSYYRITGYSIPRIQRDANIVCDPGGLAPDGESSPSVVSQTKVRPRGVDVKGSEKESTSIAHSTQHTSVLASILRKPRRLKTPKRTVNVEDICIDDLPYIHHELTEFDAQNKFKNDESVLPGIQMSHDLDVSWIDYNDGEDEEPSRRAISEFKSSVKYTETSSSKKSTTDTTCNIAERGRESKIVRICCISDTHQYHRDISNIPECDIFIHAGDITFSSRRLSKEIVISKLSEFNEWLGSIPARHRLVVGGNHDVALQRMGHEQVQKLLSNCIFMCNTYIELYGLKIFGTPFSSGHSMNYAYQDEAFGRTMMTEIEALKASDKLDIDVLISHGPSHTLTQIFKPKILHVWGHVHEFRGLHLDCSSDEALDCRYPRDRSEYFSSRDGDLTLLYKHYDDIPDDKRLEWLSVCCCYLDGSDLPSYLPYTFDIVM